MACVSRETRNKKIKKDVLIMEKITMGFNEGLQMYERTTSEGTCLVSAESLTELDKFTMLAQLQEVKNNEILSNFVNKKIAMLIKKKEKQISEPRKLSKKQIEAQAKNSILVQNIYDTLTEMQDISVTIDDLQTQIEGLQNLSKQKIAFLMKSLVDIGKVEKSKTEKGKIVYSIVIK